MQPTRHGCVSPTLVLLGEFRKVNRQKLAANLQFYSTTVRALCMVVVMRLPVQFQNCGLALGGAVTEILPAGRLERQAHADAVRRALELVDMAPDALRVEYRIAEGWRRATGLVRGPGSDRVVVWDAPRLRDRVLIRRAGLPLLSPTAPQVAVPTFAV